MTDRERVAAATGRRVLVSCCLLFALALGVRLLYLHQLSGTPFRDELGLITDARYYDMRAAEIAAGELFADVPGFLSPGYCLFLGALYAVAGQSVAGVKIAHALLGALSVVLLYLAGRRLFSERVGLLSAILLACYATHVFYTGLMLPATLVLFVHLLLIWVLASGWSARRAAVAGLLVGFAILVKANALLLLPALSVWLWLARPEPGPRSRLARLALLWGLAAVVVAPITIQNYRVSKSFLLVTTTGGANLLKGNGPTATGTHAFLPPGAQATGVAAHLAKRVDPVAAAAQSRDLSARAVRHVLEHPGRAMHLFGRKLLLLFSAYEWGIRDQFHFVSRFVPMLRWGLLPFWAVVPLGLVGAVAALPEWRRAGLLHAVVLVQIASFVLVFVLARYRLVLVACLMPFACLLLFRGAGWVRERRLRPLVPALAGTLLLLLVGGLRFPDLPRGQGFADQWAYVGDVYAAEGRLEEAAQAYEAASRADWIDARGAESARWTTLADLVETRLRLGQASDAEELLAALEHEVRRAHPLGHLLDPRIRELRERASVLTYGPSGAERSPK